MSSVQNKISYKWDSFHFNKYKDKDISDMLPRGSRKDNLLTLNQFKLLILQGFSLKELRERYNKHLISFYSFFCQKEKIAPKEELERLYLLGFTLEECAEKINVPKSHIKYLRAFYGIKRKGAKYINRKNTELELTDKQKQIIIGSLLGDAGRGGENSIIKFKQSSSQKEYLMWKFNNLKNISTDAGVIIESKEDKRYNKINEAYRFFTSANSFVEKCNNMLYKDKKEVSIDYLESLEELGLAVWYMDDGTTDWSYKKRESTEQNITPELKICTDSFSIDSIENMINFLKERFNIDSHFRTHNGNKHRIIINTNSAYDFINIIKPHVIKSMLYKVDYEAYKKYREDKEKQKENDNLKKEILKDIKKELPVIHVKSNLFDMYYPSKNFAINIVTKCDSEITNSAIEARNKTRVDNIPINNTSTFIRVFTLFELDWSKRKKQILNFIKTIIGLNTSTVYARNCKVTEEINKTFFEGNHIQGYGTGTVKCFNLEYNKEIVASISASKHHRQGADENSIVLNRLCFKDGLSIPGGASRLFKYLKQWAKKEGYTHIISWSDNCWTSGNVYKVLNFELEAELGQDYFYWDSINNEYKSKQSQKKSSTGCPESLTEREWSIQKGLYRIWDRGKKRWVYKL